MGRGLCRRSGELLPRVSRNDLFWPFEQHFNRLFDEIFGGSSFDRSKAGYPKMDVIAADGNWKIVVAVPGVKPENVKVELLADRVRISGKMEEKYHSPEGSQQYVKELRTSSFHREVLLPEELKGKDPNATIENGILELKWELPTDNKEDASVKEIEVKPL